MTETQIQKQILDYLKAIGVVAWRSNAGRGRRNITPAPKGSPDIIGFLVGGKFLGIEVKKPGEKLSEDQRKWHQYALNYGCTIIVAHSVEEVKEIGGIKEKIR